ncbi:MAG: amino acid-binding protein, partial [Candidatus Bathyarchaeota archaeon]|nr:amino acid-binding protein [Candidatus Bathyarchaeota archaeon]
MWQKVYEKLKEYPERLNVAKVLVENGLSVRDGKVYCNMLEIPVSEVARVTKVDRRTVTQTIR